jgi:hypothetical protein
MTPADAASRAMLRHAVATLAYRANKTLRAAPAEFGALKISESSRTPAEILTHIVDLMDWALSLARGAPVWQVSTPDVWHDDVARFFASLDRFDAFLGSDEPLGCPAERLVQGPVADALTHVGQLAMLRRVAGAPIRGENYFKAEIAAGRVGPEQSQPRREFD